MIDNSAAERISSFENEMDEFSSEPSRSLDSEPFFRHPKMEEIIDSPASGSSSVQPAKKRRPIATEVVRYRLEMGQWHRKPLVGSSLRFQFFDELMEGEKSMDLLICRLCDSAYSIHSRSHCLEHIKQRHPEVITENLMNNGKMDDGNDNGNSCDIGGPSSSGGRTSSSMFAPGGGGESSSSQWFRRGVDDSPMFRPSSSEELSMSMSMFDNTPPIIRPQTNFVKRRRLITTEMAKCRLESGEWQLREMVGASVRCRFFYEIFDGEVALNTLSCKICGATYSVQSRSHYREHVRRRHSEVYCVRNGRASNNTTMDNSNMSLNTADDSLIADSPLTLGGMDGDEEDGNFSLQFQNVGGRGGNGGGQDEGGEDFNFDNLPLNAMARSAGVKIHHNYPSPFNKVRRIVTTDTVTVMNHLEAGDWQRRPIPGMSIRSRFFDEIMQGENQLNILLCKVCGSTYSAQSRSHCVEHVKKRHLSILQGDEDAPDFEFDLWKETRKPSPTSVQPQPVPYNPKGLISSSSQSSSSHQQQYQNMNGSNSDQPPSLRFRPESSASGGTQTPLSGAKKRKRPPNPVIATGPDQTIETPSFDDVLQSIASQVLLNDDEDVKFDVAEFNANALNASAGPKRQRASPHDDDGDEFISLQRKRKGVSTTQSAANFEDDDSAASPLLLGGGINDQLFALSEIGFAAAERKAEEAAQRAAEEEAASAAAGDTCKHDETDADNGASQKSTSFANHNSNNNNNASRARILRPSPSGYNNQQRNRLPPGASAAPPQLSAEGGTSAKKGQQLNHQQLLMAARTAALISGDGVAEALSPKENGVTPPELRHNAKNHYGETNGFYSPYSNRHGGPLPYGAVPYPPISANSTSNSANNYYMRQQQHQQWMNIRAGGSGLSRYGGGSGASMANPHFVPGISRPFAGGVPPSEFGAGLGAHDGSELLPSSFLHSRVISTVNNNYDAPPLTNGAFGGSALGDGSAGDEDDPFCKNCKSEFPNVLRGLNQLYERVNDLIGVMHLAMSGGSNQPLNNNATVANALHRLEKTARAGNVAVNSFAASATAARRAASINNKKSNMEEENEDNADKPKLTPAATSKDVEEESQPTDEPNLNIMDAAPSLQRMDCDDVEEDALDEEEERDGQDVEDEEDAEDDNVEDENDAVEEEEDDIEEVPRRESHGVSNHSKTGTFSAQKPQNSAQLKEDENQYSNENSQEYQDEENNALMNLDNGSFSTSLDLLMAATNGSTNNKNDSNTDVHEREKSASPEKENDNDGNYNKEKDEPNKPENNLSTASPSLVELDEDEEEEEEENEEE